MENQTQPVKTETPELIKALCNAQALFKPAVKDADNPFFKSRYADLSSVWDACKDGLAKYELFVSQQPYSTSDGKTMLRTRVYHSSGGFIESELQVVVQKQNDPQSFGSAITYFRRYALSAMLGIITDDDDAEGAMDRNNKTTQQTAPKPATVKPMTKEQREQILELLKDPAQTEADVKKVTANLNGLNYESAMQTIIYLKKQIAKAAEPNAKEAA